MIAPAPKCIMSIEPGNKSNYPRYASGYYEDSNLTWSIAWLSEDDVRTKIIDHDKATDSLLVVDESTETILHRIIKFIETYGEWKVGK